jgi:hypothetical protein
MAASKTKRAIAARERDCVIAGPSKLLRNGKAEPAAAAGDEHPARFVGCSVGHTLGRGHARAIGRFYCDARACRSWQS